MIRPPLTFWAHFPHSPLLGPCTLASLWSLNTCHVDTVVPRTWTSLPVWLLPNTRKLSNMTAVFYPFYLYTAIVESIDLSHTWFLIFKKSLFAPQEHRFQRNRNFLDNIYFYFLYMGILPTTLEESRREQHFPGIGVWGGLWATTWMQGIKPGSSRRAASDFNHF